MKQLVTERILKSYFENKATFHEKQLIKDWIKEEGNEEVFYQHLASWEANHLQFVPDEAKATQKFKNFLEGDSQAYELPKVRTKVPIALAIKYRYFSIAAAVAMLVCSVLYYFQDSFFYDVYSTSYGMTQNILLEDGSEVTLNANSTLKVPKNLTASNIREVWLSGEAFFEVAKKPNHVHFSVHTNNINVEVLGTKFNVNNRRGNTEVVLNEGSIKLTSVDDRVASSLFMKPGDCASLTERDTTFKRMIVRPEKYNAWQANKLIFERTPLRIVAEKIEDYYGVKIRIANAEIAERQLTGTLPNNDLGVVLKSLSVSHKLEITREDNQIIFR